MYICIILQLVHDMVNKYMHATSAFYHIYKISDLHTQIHDSKKNNNICIYLDIYNNIAVYFYFIYKWLREQTQHKIMIYALHG